MGNMWDVMGIIWDMIGIMWDVMGTEIRIDREKNFIDNEVCPLVPTGVPRS